jgi:hypothetical protein
LLQRASLDVIRVKRVRARRFFRVGGALLSFVALVAGAALLMASLNAPANLLQGKPWRTSSIQPGFDPREDMTDRPERLFFHTQEEVNPWIEFDLGVPTAFSSIRVLNRGDCCTDRAVPLVLEASDDAKTWTTLARRDEPFDRWRRRFSPTKARYVRLRAGKRTMLHLREVSLH